MIEIRQLKLPITHTKEELEEKIKKKLKRQQLPPYQIKKQSLDARKHHDLLYVYTIHVDLFPNEKQKETIFTQKLHNNNIMSTNQIKYKFPESGNMSLEHPPIIVGMGPAGLFCGLLLARAGYCPILIERGEDVDTRIKDVENFFGENILKPNSNVQFGEGGAGTFSDGKLNTLVKDQAGRNEEVLRLFAEYGASEKILYMHRPHIGTDLLRKIVKNMRNDIVSMGGSVHFNTCLTNVFIKNQCVESIECISQDKKITMPCESLILALGHSARDTIAMLYEKGLSMHQKDFAIGLRIEHKKSDIDASQYGESKEASLLPAAYYKLTHRAKNGRNIFSFCMCPGGYVVNASSEENKVVVNGMSYSDQASENSNAALIVGIQTTDFESDHPLAGIAYQRKWEEAAFLVGGGNIPVQLFGDFVRNVSSMAFGEIKPNIKGSYMLSNLNDCLPDYVKTAIIEGVYTFDKKIKGYARADAILSGIESRTTSPVRIERDENLESNIGGIYPCGEGAGYAGGITSAAMDGMKVAEEVICTYQPLRNE